MTNVRWQKRRALVFGVLSLLVFVSGCAHLMTSQNRFPHVEPAARAALPGPETPVRILVEGEDFVVKSGAWSIVPYRENYFASTFAITFLSRQALLGAPEQVDTPAVAERQVTIPYDDSYYVMARYEQPYTFACEFDIEIVQNGKVVYRGAYGRLEDPKIWALNQHKRVPMERYFWGGTDNIVWQHFDPIALTAGSATIRLLAGPQMAGAGPRLNAARRHVDVVALTNDKEGMERQQRTRYLEFDGWLLQQGDLFARITNLGEEARIFTLTPYAQGQHSPYYIHVREWGATHVTRDGIVPHALPFAVMGPRADQVDARHLATVDPGGPIPARNLPHAERGLLPRQSSAWIPLGQMLDSLHNSKWSFNPGAPARLELAKPDGRGGLKTLWHGAVSESVDFEIPQVVNPSPSLAAILAEGHFSPVIRTQVESLRWLRDKIVKFPAVGKTPDRLLLYNIMGFSGVLQSKNEELRQLAREIALHLGDNTMVGQEGNKRGLRAHWRSIKLDDLRKMKEDGRLEDVYVASYGDEIHLPAMKPDEAEFQAFLKAHKAPGWEKAAYTTDPEHPWFYYSQLAAYEKGAQAYAAATAFYAENGILTGANYSPHSNYLISEIQYIRTFKLKAMSMPWSEDYVWQVPEFSIQATGWLTSAFRAATKYHHMPIHMYIMPHSPGNTAKDFRLSFYNAIAHGAKMIDYFCATPLAVGSTENYVATQDLDMWRGIYDVSRQAGIFEDYVMDGRVRQARAGLLLSSVDDIHTKVSNTRLAMHNNERKAFYYAARHAQVPIDFLTEDDVIDGLAAEYDTIYVAQEYLHSDALKALRQWVENGGTLVSTVGGGFKDEFRRENPAAAALFGVSAQQRIEDPDLLTYLQRPDIVFLTKQDLPLYRPFDTVTWRAGELAGTDVGVIVWKQTLTPADGDILATFADGSPAAVMKTHGKGRAVLLGFFPGQAYLKSGLPIRPADRGGDDNAFTHYQPTGMDPQLRRLMIDQWLPADYIRPVATDAYLVEATLIDTQKPTPRLAIPLMNYSGKPIAHMTVTVPGVSHVRSIRSVEHERVEYAIKDGTLIVHLPLDLTDMILVDY